MKTDALVAQSAYAILNGVSINLGLYSFFFARFAKVRYEKAGYVVCSLALLALFLFTLLKLTPSWWLGFCDFAGFGITAMTLTKQTTKTSSPQVIDVGKLRKANEYSRQISSAILSLLTLVLPAAFVLPRTSFTGFSLGLSLILVVALAISWLADFFARPSRLVCFLSALSALLLVLAALIPLENLLATDSGIWTNLGIALPNAAALFLYSHASALSKLSPYVLALANAPARRSLLSLRHSVARPGVPRPRAALAWLFDLLARLSLGLGGFVKLFFVGQLLFLLGTIPYARRTDIAWLASNLTLRRVAKFGGVQLALILGTVSFRSLAALLARASRSLSVSTYPSTMEHDPRAPILFLRAFANDQGQLPKASRFARLWRAGLEASSIDHELTYEYSLLGPVVALGPPGSTRPSFGAARRDLGVEADWIAEVSRIAETALAVVVVCAGTESIDREIEVLRSAGLLRKVLFLANPETPTQGLERDRSVRPLLPAATTSIVAGFYQVGEVSRVLITARLDPEDFVVCCRAFFSELARPDAVAQAFDRLPLPAEV